MSKLNVLAEEILIKVGGKRTLCKAVLLSDRGGHVVSYLDKDGIELKSQPLYRSPFKDKVKEIKELKAEQAPKQEQEQPTSELVETLRKACETAGLTNQQLAEKYDIPLQTLEAWLDDAPPEDYVLNLLLRCLAADFPATEESVLSEQEPVTKPVTEPVKKPAYTLHTTWGKRLTPEQAAEVEKEIADDKVAWVADFDDGSGWKQYKCTEKDIEYVIRPVKEV